MFSGAPIYKHPCVTKTPYNERYSSLHSRHVEMRGKQPRYNENILPVSRHFGISGELCGLKFKLRASYSVSNAKANNSK